MAASIVIALNVFLNVVRKKILYVLFLFAAALILALPLMPSFGVGVKLDLFRDFALGLTSLFSIVITIAVGVNEIPSEVERRTVYNILAKPVPRFGFIAGKLLGLALTLAVVIGLMTSIAFATTAVYFGIVDPGLFVAGWAILLETSVIAAFIVLASTFATPPVTATLAVVFYFIGHVKQSLLGPALQGSSAASPAARLLSYALPNLQSLNANEAIAHGARLGAAELAVMTLYAAAFVLAFLVLGGAVFQRKDL